MRLLIMVWGIVWATMAGCAGKGEVMPVNVPAQPPAADAASAALTHLRVPVEPFEDTRATKARLGTRAHLWDGDSSFDVPGGSVADAATKAPVGHLDRNGWQAYIVKPGGASSDADVSISGRLLALSLDAKSRVGSPKRTTTRKITLHAFNGADGSTVRMTLNGVGSERALWFEPEDAPELVNTMLDASVAPLLQSTSMEGKVLGLRD